MVEAGSLKITGSLDTSNIIRGLRTITRGFETVKQKTLSSFSSMELLAGSASKLGTALIKVSTAAVGGLTFLAGFTPVLASNFAKLKVETFKLAQIFGNEMKPAFDDALTSYTSFVNFLGSGTGMAELIKDVGILTGAAGLGLLASKLTGLPKTLTIGITLLVTSKTVEESVENLTGSEILGDVAGGATSAIGGGLIGQAIGGLFKKSLRGLFIGSIIGGAPKAFEVGRDLADKLVPDYVLNSDKSFFVQFLDSIFKSKNNQDVSLEGIFRNTRDNTFNNIDTLGID